MKFPKGFSEKGTVFKCTHGTQQGFRSNFDEDCRRGLWSLESLTVIISFCTKKQEERNL